MLCGGGLFERLNIREGSCARQSEHGLNRGVGEGTLRRSAERRRDPLEIFCVGAGHGSRTLDEAATTSVSATRCFFFVSLELHRIQTETCELNLELQLYGRFFIEEI